MSNKRKVNKEGMGVVVVVVVVMSMVVVVAGSEARSIIVKAGKL
jgi:hypothetical protein